MWKISIVIVFIIAIYGCVNENFIYQTIPKPDSLTLKIIYPQDGQLVEKVSNIRVFGNCLFGENTNDIYIYPIVKAPDGNYYPYYKFSINPDKTWDSFLYLGQESDVSGARFDVYFCAVFRKDAFRLDSAHVPNRDHIKSIGSDIPEYCRIVTKISLFLK